MTPAKSLRHFAVAFMGTASISAANAKDMITTASTHSHDGIYAVDILAPEYGRLPGVTNTDGDNVDGDGPTICVTSGPDTWHYVFDAASGDCPAGCIDHAYSHFTTSTVGTVVQLETWSSASGGSAPAWVSQYASRTVCR